MCSKYIRKGFFLLKRADESCMISIKHDGYPTHSVSHTEKVRSSRNKILHFCRIAMKITKRIIGLGARTLIEQATSISTIISWYGTKNRLIHNDQNTWKRPARFLRQHLSYLKVYKSILFDESILHGYFYSPLPIETFILPLWLRCNVPLASLTVSEVLQSKKQLITAEVFDLWHTDLPLY